MKYASIDIGTNTIRLLIAELKEKELIPIVYKRAITRLGGGFTKELGIDKASSERTLNALEGFKNTIAQYDAKTVFAVATSVVRRAVNREEFLKDVKKRTGIKVSVISGREEASLALTGVLSIVGEDDKGYFTIDIGGGSTEFILSKGNNLINAWSMEMGVVHLTEKYLKSDPASPQELVSMEHEIKTVIKNLKELMKESGAVSGYEFVGTAGTITTLAAIDLDLQVYDRDVINNHILKKDRIKEIYKQLISLTLKQRKEVLSLEKGREDLIIPGTAIVLITMDSFGFNELRVSDAGLLEGLIIREFLTEGNVPPLEKGGEGGLIKKEVLSHG